MAKVKTPTQPGVKRFIGLDWNFGAVRDAGPGYWTWTALLGVFLAMGIVAWMQIILHGGEMLAMRDGAPWGLWFTNYMYYVGLSAGGLVVYASVHLFNAEQFRPLSKFAVLQAGVLVMLALLGIFTDMEHPWRMAWFMLTPNPTAPFLYTGSAAGLYMVLCFVDLWILMTGKGGEKLAMTMTLIALPAAIYLHTTTAFVLAMNKSRELWHSAVMVPIFLTSATASGIALLFIFAYVVQKFGGFVFKPSMFRSLATVLATVMIIDIFLLLVEVLWVFWPTSAMPGHTIRLQQFINGRLWWSFIPVLVLGISAFALLARRSTRHLPAVQLTASIMYVIAIFLKRYALMAMGFAIDPLGQEQPIYVPSAVEIFLALGLLALGLLIVTFAIKLLPMTMEEHEHGHGHAPSPADEAPAEPALAAEGASR